MSHEYNLLFIADLDQDSIKPCHNGEKPCHNNDKTCHKGGKHHLYSILLTGTINLDNNTISIDKEVTHITSGFAYHNRGMELSELILFNNKLYTCDDKTGIVYLLSNKQTLVPWAILADGDGESINKGLKAEWMTVKDNFLLVGGHGTIWVNRDLTTNENPLWIKQIDSNGGITHINWKDNYNKLKIGCNIPPHGYITHEACIWSEIHKKWFFLPRRVCIDHFNHSLDNEQSSNYLISADEDFSNVKFVIIGTVLPRRGFSAFKFIPNTNDTLIIALKTEENQDKQLTFVSLFDINGQIFIQDQLIALEKFEGLEIIIKK